ncbi:CDP-glycerol glycerophosphotransferase family protein, partial [Staphylococcus epidermidis]|uniref:CDP-glycerol glycerophosphotransferase family protein n=1 Tax=Staphylococcus epidermidis TaxID=1282 RepID=UPI00164252C2
KPPQFFFPYHIHKYHNPLPPFYINYMQHLPPPIYTQPYPLPKQLNNLHKLQHQYQQKIHPFYHTFSSLHNPNASQYIA